MKRDVFKEVMGLYSTGETIRDISKKVGISEYRISSYLKDNGVVIRKGCKKSLEKYKTGKELYLKGNSICHISKVLGVSRSRFSQYLKSEGVEIKQLPHKIKFDNTVFEKIDSEDKAYWLGFLYADGSIGENRSQIELQLSEKDKAHVYKFRDFIKSTHKISLKNNKLGSSYRIIVEDVNMHRDLIKLGCTPRKSLTLKFPTEEQVPKHLLPHFIRGYFDGDGGFSDTDKTLCVNILGTKEFLEGLKKEVFILNNKKIYPMSYKDNNKNTYRIQFGSRKDIKIFLDYIYKNSNINLDRKYEKYKNFVCRAM